MNKIQFQTLYFEITHACNQSCKHCYLDGGIHHNIMELNTDQIKDIIKRFKNQGGSYVIITGGEPTVRKDLFEILDYIDLLEIPFELATNCLLLNEDKLNKLVSYKHLDLIFTSLLGTTKEEHLYISGKDTYDKVFRCIDFFDKNEIKTYVQITLAKKYIGNIMVIADKLSKFKLCNMKFTPIADMGVKTDDLIQKELILEEDDYLEFLYILSKIKKKYGDKIENSNIWTIEQIKESIFEYENDQLYSLNWKYICLRPNGDKSFSFSIDNPYIFGSALDEIEVLDDEYLSEYINILRKVDKEILDKYGDKEAVNYDGLVDAKIKSYYNKSIENIVEERLK